jgi:large subunit ribosomal protein L31e
MEEKLYTIPLSRAKTAPKVRRSLSAIKVIKEYLSRNLDIDMNSVHMDPSINEAIWSRGNKKIPSKLRVRVVQSEEGIIEASLPGVKTRSEIEMELEKKAKKEKKQEKEKEEKKGKEEEEKESGEAKEEGEKQEDKTVDEGAESSGKDDKKKPKNRVTRKETDYTDKKNAKKDEESSKKRAPKNISIKEKEG